LRACLAAGRLVIRAELAVRKIVTTDKPLPFDRGDEPMIGVATDVAATGYGTSDGGDEMRIPRFAHKAVSRGRTMGRDKSVLPTGNASKASEDGFGSPTRMNRVGKNARWLRRLSHRAHTLERRRRPL
jgi:hypothetical protein